MTYEKSIEVKKLLFEEYSSDIAKKDIKWLKEKIISLHPDWVNLEDKSKFEYYVLDELNTFLYAIQKDKPSNVREYVERELKKKEYQDRYKKITNKILSIKSGDDEACNKLSKELHEFMDEAEKEISGFKKSYAFAYSEAMGHILAKRTRGFAGSTGMTRAERENELREELEMCLKDNKPEELLDYFENKINELKFNQKEEAFGLKEAFRVFIIKMMDSPEFYKKNRERIVKISEEITEKAT